MPRECQHRLWNRGKEDLEAWCTTGIDTERWDHTKETTRGMNKRNHTRIYTKHNGTIYKHYPRAREEPTCSRKLSLRWNF
ncbi:hypothetical protein chiPu_0000871 [Chiloscyllium punctatum]|uniref:Uncharacterized protein n=1 Tax=Chiloscyllium punctatum TaxID=137246 RepID=A0A401RWH5_CHIPU|nr:hypothetical protein [Chiloscyllium punctatum]